jgi:gamma-glutamyltranspeptidase / glutathione hydrolase
VGFFVFSSSSPYFTMLTRRFCLSLLVVTTMLCACSANKLPMHANVQPEAPVSYSAKQGVFSHTFMAATANPLSTNAAYAMLEAGGSAVDAAIAAQLVLTLTEPQSSGLGGGSLMMHWDGKSVTALDGRETAPMGVTETMFQDGSGNPIGFYDAVLSGQSVGVPGTVRLLESAHQRWGVLPWGKLFEPAITLAEQGFAISPRLHGLLKLDQYLIKDSQAAAYFYQNDGQPKPIGYKLINMELAQVLRALAQHSSQSFYQGSIAKDIVAKVRNNPIKPGTLTEKDLENYKVKKRQPICSPYREYQVCGFPPPSSGGIAIAQMLTMLERFPLAAHPPVDNSPSAQSIYWLSEAGRLAYADRAAYVADSDFVPLTGKDWGGLLNADYLKSRSDLIKDSSIGRAEAGTPPNMSTAYAPATAQPEYGTSHISIVDAKGHAVSMTSTIEDMFGSRQMVHGFLLNNELTDFEFTPTISDKPIANRIQPGKRPRSSMSPMLVLNHDGSELQGALGSPGGSLIINYVLKTAVALIDWHLSPQAAVALPNAGSRNNGVTELEKDQIPQSVADALKTKGQEVRYIDQTSGTQAIWRMNTGSNKGWLGGADPRREGTVKGD